MLIYTTKTGKRYNVTALLRRAAYLLITAAFGLLLFAPVYIWLYR